jgi:hypothetical protein
MRFPTRPAPCGSARELVQDLNVVINRFVELPAKLTELVAFSVLSSWFVDCAAIPPSLWIVGPRFGPGSQLLRLLNCLYRRPLLLGEISLAGLCSLPLQLRPSLLFEQWEISSDLLRFLKALHAGDGRILHKGQVMEIGCMTAICTEEPLNPSASGKAIEIPMTRSRRRLEVFDQQVQDKIANDFQPKLLMYRLTNAHRVQASTSTVSEPMFAIGQFAHCWEACAAGDPDLQDKVSRIIKDWDAQVREDLETDLVDPIIVEAMLSICHQANKRRVHVGEITAMVNEILEDRGEIVQVRARMVGNRLRALGLSTTRLDAAGRGILLFAAIRKSIHNLAWDHKILTPLKGVQDFVDCADTIVERDIDDEIDEDREVDLTNGDDF